MRLLKHINEERLQRSKNVPDFTVTSVIEKNCKPFLKEMKGGDLFWRGTEKNIKDIKIFTPRTDRRPRDTDVEVHNYLDGMFNKFHGWKARSSGVFVTNYREDTKLYGNSYAFFPIGKYKYLWNPEVRDLKQYYIEVSAFTPDTPEEKEEDKSLIASYKSTNLKQATVKDSEVMFLCKSYYLVDAKGSLHSKLEDLL